MRMFTIHTAGGDSMYFHVTSDDQAESVLKYIKEAVLDPEERNYSLVIHADEGEYMINSREIVGYESVCPELQGNAENEFETSRGLGFSGDPVN